MSVEVQMPQKKESSINKLMQVGQMAMKAKEAFGKGGDSQIPGQADAMTRRMETLRKQRAMGEQGPTPY